MESSNYDKIIENARNAFDEENYEEAIKNYKLALIDGLYEKDLFDYVVCCLRYDKFDDALNLLEIAKNTDDNNPSLYYFYGMYYRYIEEIEEAIKMQKKAIEMGLETPNSYYELGLCYHIKSDIDLLYEKDAQKYYEKAIKLDPNHPYSLLNLANIYERQDQNEKALEFALRASKLIPEEETVSYNLGVIYYKLGDYDKMKECYLKEINKPHPSYLAYYNLGIYYKEIKDYKKAKECYVKSLEIKKDDYAIWYNLGCIHVLETNYESAEHCFKCSYLLDNNTFDYMTKDDELKDFIKSKEFENLCKLK